MIYCQMEKEHHHALGVQKKCIVPESGSGNCRVVQTGDEPLSFLPAENPATPETVLTAQSLITVKTDTIIEQKGRTHHHFPMESAPSGRHQAGKRLDKMGG